MGFRIIIHVGPWKTGSSALQEFFHLNRDLLLNHGVFYPRGIVAENAQHEIPNSIMNAMSRFSFPQKSQSVPVIQFIKNFFDEMRSRNVSTLLLSSEDFAGMNSKHYSRLIEAFLSEVELDLEYIYFDFDPKSRLDSFKNQYIRQGEYINKEASSQILKNITKIKNDFESATQNYPAKVHRIDYEKLSSSNDIYEKALGFVLKEKVTLNSDKWSIPSVGINASISPEKTALLNDFNKYNIGDRPFDESCPIVYSESFPKERDRFNKFYEVLSGSAHPDNAIAERDSKTYS